MTAGRARVTARRGLGLLAGVAACFYVAWNAYWIGRGLLPPSIFKHFTGLPVPTTGLTRAVLALGRGDVAASVAWNAFAVPILGLLAASAVTVLRRLWRGERIALPPRLMQAWLGVLALAWVVKLVQGPTWW